MVIYVVQPGDTAESIAREYGVPLSRLISQNEIGDGGITVGQTLVILYPKDVYTVVAGDTLASIAEKYGITVNQLLRNNPILKGRTDIYIGQTIIIDYDTEKGGTMAVNGYIYPFIDREVLIKTLPYLTYLTLFTYGFTPDGELVDSGITEFGLDEGEIISLAYEYGVAPVMHLSTLTPDGTFSSQLGNEFLNNQKAQEVLIQNVLDNMGEKGYYGFDVDFEYLDGSNRDKYTDFVRRLGIALNEAGYILITALVPKTSPEQPGSFYESHDYKGIGAVSNYVLLMTYEWGYAYGPPMAVAPLNQVERVLNYGIDVIDNRKIFLGVPNYGYDWRLPYIKGETKAEKLSNTQAVDLAIIYGAYIQFDEVAQSPFFTYVKEGSEHIVWFEDARSISEKLKLASSNDLYGVGYWNLMSWFPQNWLVLNAKYNIVKVL